MTSTMPTFIGAAIAFCLSCGTASAALVVANLEDETNGGGFFGTVTFEDVAMDTVKVTADIADPINVGLTQGDILGLWFDISEESLVSSLDVQNENPANIVTGLFKDPNNVNSLGGNNNLNGSGQSNFDIGVALGDQGAPDFFQMASFDFFAAGLMADMFAGQRVGMRVQSIEGGSFGAGSAKLIGAGELAVVPLPAALPLFLSALAGLGLIGWRRKQAA